MTETNHPLVATVEAAPGSENAAVIAVAQDAVRAQPLKHPGLFYDAKTATIIDIRGQIREDDASFPVRKAGTYKVTDVPSFIGYIKKHALTQTEIWANVNAGTVRAVINAHMGTTGDGIEDYAGREDHTATLQLATTDDWKEWTEHDGKLHPQLAFAEFIEDHLPNFQNPSAADMLELAQTFQATTKVDFESSQRVKSGETQIAYVENTTATAGKKGGLTIPDTFTIALQPFENGPAYKVEARFRYRITDGHLQLAYRLNRPKDVRKLAFDDAVKGFSDDTGREIWATA